jgi:hypothetical protein
MCPLGKALIFRTEAHEHGIFVSTRTTLDLLAQQAATSGYVLLELAGSNGPGSFNRMLTHSLSFEHFDVIRCSTRLKLRKCLLLCRSTKQPFSRRIKSSSFGKSYDTPLTFCFWKKSEVHQ